MSTPCLPDATHSLGLEKEIRLVSFVPRWAIVKTLREQNLADHQWHVAMIAWRMSVDCKLTDIPGFDMANLLLSAMTHDLEETVSSDIPSPANKFLKKECPAWKPWLQERTREFFPWYKEDPTVLTKDIVAIADLLEAILFLGDEIERGNSYVIPHKEYLVGLMDSLMLATATKREEWHPEFSRTGAVQAWVSNTLFNATRPARVLGTILPSSP